MGTTVSTNPGAGGSREPLDTPGYLQFAGLVRARRFPEAETLASSILSKHAGEWGFWKTQLGYVCFLNEEDAEAHFERAPDHFTELLVRLPNDPNARFWKGYVELIVHEAYDSAREDLQVLLQMAPDHPYASLVLGGIPQEESQAIRHLEQALRVIPNNFRALRDLGQRFSQVSRRDEARRMFEALIEGEPFLETRYGVMNGYINDVLTGAAHVERWKAEARRELAADR